MTEASHFCPVKKRYINLPLGYRCEYCHWVRDNDSSAPHPGMLTTNNFLMVNPDATGWTGWNQIHSATTSSPHDSIYSFDFTEDTSQAWMTEGNFEVNQSSYPVSRSQSQRERNFSVPQDHHSPMTQSRLSTSYPGQTSFSGRDHDENPLFPTQPSTYSAEHLNVPQPEYEQVEPEVRSTRQSQSAQTNPQNRVACNFCSNTFSRQADVDRHVDTVHNRDQRQQQGNLLDCPWPDCHRKGNRAFARKDHWLEHRRNFHNEYIPKRRSRSRSSRHSGGSDDLPRASN